MSSAAALQDKTLQFIDPSPEPGLKNVEWWVTAPPPLTPLPSLHCPAIKGCLLIWKIQTKHIFRGVLCGLWLELEKNLREDSSFTITGMAPTRAFSLLKPPTSAFTWVSLWLWNFILCEGSFPALSVTCPRVVMVVTTLNVTSCRPHLLTTSDTLQLIGKLETKLGQCVGSCVPEIYYTSPVSKPSMSQNVWWVKYCWMLTSWPVFVLDGVRCGHWRWL